MAQDTLHPADHSTRRAPFPPRLDAFLAENPAGDVVGTGPARAVSCPATGQVLAEVRQAGADDVAAAADRARAAQRDWAEIPAAERAKVLLRLHGEIRRHEELLLDLGQAETGKARLHAYDEVMDAYNVCRFVGRSAPRVLAEERRRGAIPGLTTVRVQRIPCGVVGFVTPWNYPMSLGANDLLAALAAGNAVVHKPDSATTLTAVLMRRLAVRAGLPEDLWQLVPGPVEEVGDALVEAVDALSFTGSTAAGRGIAATTGSRLLPTTLELGGKNPMIVCEDAPLKRAVEGAVRGCFSSTGQLCLSIERLVAVGSEKRFEEFAARFAAATRGLRLGFGFEHSAEVGSLVSPAHRERVEAFVDDAVAQGARVLAGGRARPDLGPAFYEPTILADVPETARFFREESFGPVVALFRAEADEEAVVLANDSEYGLNASVWAGTRRHGMAVAGRVEAGMVNVNEAFAAAWGSVGAPSGGLKASGLGHRHGPEGILEFTRSRTVAHQALLPIAPAGPLDARRFQKTMTGALALMKAARLR